MACGAQWDEYQWAASGNEKLACEDVFAHVATYGYCARSAGSCVCENPLDVTTKMSARAETVRRRVSGVGFGVWKLLFPDVWCCLECRLCCWW